MANYLKRKDIAELTGKSQQYIGVQIKRGHLIEENKRIDTDNIKNKAFLSKYLTKEIEKSENKEDQRSENKINQGNIDYVVRQHDLKLKAVRLKLETLDLEKKKGKVIPSEFVQEMMQRYVNGTFGDVINEGNKLIDELCNELESDIEIKLKYKKQLNVLVTEILKTKHKFIKDEIVEYAKEFALKTKW